MSNDDIADFDVVVDVDEPAKSEKGSPVEDVPCSSCTDPPAGAPVSLESDHDAHFDLENKTNKYVAAPRKSEFESTIEFGFDEADDYCDYYDKDELNEDDDDHDDDDDDDGSAWLYESKRTRSSIASPSSRHQRVSTISACSTKSTFGVGASWRRPIHTMKMLWRNQRVIFIWWILYFLGNFGAFYYKANLYATSPKHATARNVFGNCLVAARGAANCLNFNGLLIVLTMCRHFWAFIKSFQCACLQPPKKVTELYLKRFRFPVLIPLDLYVAIHKVVGVVFAFWVAVHVSAHMCDFYRFAHYPNKEDLELLLPQYDEIMPSDPKERWNLVLQQPASITGIIMVVCMLIAYPCIVFRHKLGYTVFASTHQLLVLMLVALMFHGMGQILESFKSVYWVGIPLVLYGAPLIWREVAGSCCKRAQVEVLELTVKPGDVVVLKLTKPLSWKKDNQCRKVLKAGMHARLNIPKISRLEWHPFTLTSAPSDDYLEFHIRPVGDWTGALYDLALETTDIIMEEPMTAGPAKGYAVSLTKPSKPITFRELVPPTSNQQYSFRLLWIKELSSPNLRGMMAFRSNKNLTSKKNIVQNERFFLSNALQDTSMEIKKDHQQEQLETSLPSLQDLNIKVDGPMGASSQLYDHYGMVLLIGAGIGITPMMSVLKELLANPGKMERTYLIWTFRERSAIDWFAHIIHDVLIQKHPDKRGILNLRFFVTHAAQQQNRRSSCCTRMSLAAFSTLPHDNQYDFPCTVVYGRRPNWNIELTRVKEHVESLDHSQCAIFVCGPASMNQKIQQASLKLSKDDPKFSYIFYQECFSF